MSALFEGARIVLTPLTIGDVAWLDARGVAAIQAHIHPEHAASAAVARGAGLRPTGQIEDGEQLWRRRRPDGGPAGGVPGGSTACERALGSRARRCLTR